MLVVKLTIEDEKISYVMYTQYVLHAVSDRVLGFKNSMLDRNNEVVNRSKLWLVTPNTAPNKLRTSEIPRFDALQLKCNREQMKADKIN